MSRPSTCLADPNTCQAILGMLRRASFRTDSTSRPASSEASGVIRSPTPL